MAYASERPSKGAEPQAKRVVLEFSGESHAKLVQLKNDTDSPSVVDVVRRAVKLFEFFVLQLKEGWRIQLVNKDGTVREVEILF